MTQVHTEELAFDPAPLRALYVQPRFVPVFDYLAARQHNSTKTTVLGLQTALKKKGIDRSLEELADLLKRLGAAGCGRFIVGRRDHPSRFQWSVSLIAVGRTARGDPTGEDGPGNLINQTVTENVAERIRHSFRLRPSTELELLLPTDLTHDEALRVAGFIKTLPFHNHVLRKRSSDISKTPPVPPLLSSPTNSKLH